MKRLIVLALLFQSALSTRENIARNKTVYQSTTFDWAPPSEEAYKWAAEFAIDGKTTFTGDMCRCCSGVGYETNWRRPWWEIDLGMVNRLGKVRVHGRYDEAGIHQLRGFEMFLSETTPYVKSSTAEPVYVNDVTKPRYTADKGKTSIDLGDMAARYVAISLHPHPWNGTTLMVICEVEIFQACEVGSFGPNCTKTCGHCANGVGCNVTTGECEGGCQAGYNGTLCQIECTSGSYGPNCNEECGKCLKKEQCNISNGQCAGGCKAGYKGDLCITACEVGSFGPNCANSCGHCALGNGCNVTTGECEGGCQAGYNGTLCQTVTSESSIDKGSSTRSSVGFVVAAIGALGIMLTIGFLLRNRRNKTSTEGRPDVNDDDSSPTGGFDNAMRLLAVSSAIRPVEDPPEAIDAILDEDKVIPVHKLWDFVQTQRDDNFELLTSQFKSLESGLLHKHEVGSRPENRTKHKYGAIFAYDRNRVKLQVTRPGETDYINASIIDGFDRPGKFIASQGPMNAMVDDFWRMIWQQQTSIVVMLANLEEVGKSKCIKYWPEAGETRIFGLVKVVLKSIDRVLNYDVRRLEVVYDGKEYRRVTQYHFKSWPDKNVPANAWCLVNFWRVVDEAASSATPTPIVVHCSAGIGRTGTFIALDNTCCQGRQTGDVSPLTIVQALRQQRINMVRTRGQYVYLHKAVAEALLFGTDCVSVSQFEDMVAYMRHGSRLESQFQLIEKSVANHINDVDALYRNVSNIPPLFRYQNQEQKVREDNLKIAEKQHLEPVLFQNYLKKTTFLLCNYPSKPNWVDVWTRLLAFKPMTIVTLPDDRTVGEDPTRTNIGIFASMGRTTEAPQEPGASQRSVKVFEYSCWQAGCSIPNDTRSLLEMVRAIRLWQPTLADDKPIIIMCSDGFSRSGLVCALLSEIDRIECTDGQTNFVHTVKTMKATKKEVIQTYDQYRFCMDALLSYITKADEVYQNVLEYTDGQKNRTFYN